jgi:hypothetical protein
LHASDEWSIKRRNFEIGEHAKIRRFRQQIAQGREPLADKLTAHRGYSSDVTAPPVEAGDAPLKPVASIAEDDWIGSDMHMADQ